ncbi:CAP domain-containing protein [Dietzia maris]|uniref:CAP domain-containing protein n=1 Tax=Dietzia maris TaxID=37915 RepID=UPI0037C51D8A
MSAIDGNVATIRGEQNITAQAATTEIPPQANALERLTNEQREAHDLPALATNELLRQSACHKAADMVKHDYFAHVAPDGTEPWHYFREAGYTYQHAGENLARNFTDDAAVVQAWMDSPTHRDNVLGDFEEQGTCSVEGVTVQHLGVRG